MKSIIMYHRTYVSLSSGLVCSRRADFEDLPTLQDISPLYVKEMSMNEESHIKQWLNIVNQSFSRNWEKKDYLENITNHKIYNVLYTYFLMDGERYIGIVSEAVFKRNKQVGVTHYLGLDKEYLGHGLGKFLILYTLHKMKEHSLKSCEVETTLDYKKSLFIHFDLGFRPKAKPDYWNTVRHVIFPIRTIIIYKFKRLYEEWKRI